MKYILNKIVKFITKTKLRKALSLTLALLILLTSIKFIFLSPSEVSAASSFMKFDEGYGTTANDTNSNVSGTITNAVWKGEDLCFSGKCLYFDGTGDYISFGDDSDLDFAGSDSFTIEGWFRTTDITSGQRTLVAKYNSTTGTDGGYKVYMDSSGYLIFGIDSDQTSFPSDSVSTTTTAFDDNKWHHFAAVKSGATSITLYVDAVQYQTDSSITSSTLVNSDTFYVGIDGDGSSNGYQGYIDEVKVYATARTSDQIKTDKIGETGSRGTQVSFSAEQKSISDGLAAYFRLGESSGFAYDSSGNGLILSNQGSTPFVNGKFGNGADLESGSSQYFSANTTSIALGQTANNGTMVHNNSTISLTFSQTPSDNDIIYLLYVQTAAGPATRTWPTGFTELFSDNGGSGSTYISLAWKRASSETSATYTLNLGDTGDGNQQLLGVTYTGAATLGDPNEVVSSLATLGSTPISVGSINTLTDKAKHIIFVGSGDNQGTPAATGYNLDGQGSTYARTAILSKNISAAGATGSVSVSNLTNVSNNTYASISLKPLQSTSNYTGVNLTGSVTMSAWIKPESTTAATQFDIFGKWDSTKEGYLLAQYGDEIRMYINSTSVYEETTASNLTTGTWYHVLGVYDSQKSTIKIYINGTLATSSTTGTVPSSITHTDGIFHIGSANSLTTANNFYDGVIDEVRLYNKALDVNEIKKLYSFATAPAAYWNFDEGSGNTIYDKSGNGNLIVYGGTATTPTSLADGSNSTTAGQTITTSSISPTAGKKLLIFVIAQNNGHNNGNSWGISASAGDTPTLTKQSSAYSWAGDANYSISAVLFTLSVSSGGSRTFTLDANNTDTSTYFYSYVILEVDNTSYVQSIVANGATIGSGGTPSNSGTGSLTLGSNPISGNNVIVLAGKSNDATGALSTPTGYTSLANQTQTFTSVGAFYKNNTTTAAVSFTDLGESVGNWAGFIIEQLLPSTTPSWDTGKFGKAVTFSSSQYAYASTTISDPGYYNTLSLWVYPTTSIASKTLITAGKLATDSSSRPTYGNCTGTAISLNTWTHLAVVSNGSGSCSIYQNGIQTASSSTGVSFGTAVFLGGASFIGTMDDVKIYNYARTSKQVVEDMNAGHPAPGSPVGSAQAYWSFNDLDEDGTGFARDSSGNGLDIDLGNISGGRPFTRDGKFGGAINCDNFTGQSINGNEVFNQTTGSFTFSFWFKSTSASNPASQENLIVRGMNAGSKGYEVFFDTNGYLNFGITDDTSSTPRDLVTSTQDYYDTNWHHGMAVKDGTTAIYLYVDGRLVAQKNPILSTTSISGSNTMSVCYATVNGTGNGFAGIMDEASYYTSVLDQSQAYLLFNGGKAAIFGSSNTTVSNSPWSDLGYYCPPGTTCNPPIWDMRFEQGPDSTINYNAAHGVGDYVLGNFTSTDTTQSWVPGKHGKGFRADGVDGFANASDVAEIDGAVSLTVSVWAKFISLSDTANIWNRRQNGNNRISMQLGSGSLGSGNNDIYIAVACTLCSAPNNVSGAVYTTADVITTGVWQHHTVVYDYTQSTNTTKVTYYLNGIKQTLSSTGTIPAVLTTASTPQRVGGESGTANSYANAIFDDMRYYNYIRSQAQIEWDYNNGAPYNYYKFDEGTGTTAYNSATNADGSGGNGNNGTITIGGSGGNTTSTSAWSNGTTGKMNYSLDLDGNDDYVSTGSFSLLAQAGETSKYVSWGGWFYPKTSAASKTIIEKASTIRLSTDASSKPVCDVYTGGAFTSNSAAASNTALSLNTWQHVLCVYDGSNIKLYVNGRLQDTWSQTGSITAASSALYIGQNSSNAQRFEGQVDEVKLWNYNLTQQQVQTDMNQNSAVRFGPNTGHPQ